MSKIISRAMVLAAAAGPIAAFSIATSATGAAQPLDCPNGWWDPVANVCRGPVATAPLACAPGEYWNPISNVCRPLGQY
ncbi:hypothetical protein AU190_10560 [Mycolicibacterium acapulense]|uniref:Chitin-binding type-2 domain-containing protein n=1 Tax=Mycobacterium lehmannii TaxID=2048550 RepID=A0A101A6P5_9MYCO|nr:hypothetical protein [Mycobacterium lehmannii]KUI08847.1 hypothetical protein AU190_10560 [Mycolicibacterium acapulense]KUI13944.1 hypothetical protein AU191_12820 [Mycolicibacterium acapulense]KUI15483.1 hypothetical protein AU192_21475 [Mycobacterium lehmannii]